jgi:hypothetical protein
MESLMNIRQSSNFAHHGSDLFAAVTRAAGGEAGVGVGQSSGSPSRRHTDHEQYSHNHDGYDDGLVHSHGWARSDR